MPILTQKWPNKWQNVKISKIKFILFLVPLRSTLCPKISLFRRFGLKFLDFSWFSGNQDFVREMSIFAWNFCKKPDFFLKLVFAWTFFLLNYVKLTGTRIKTPFKTSKQLFSGKNGQNSLKNSQKYAQITIEIALYKPYFAENGPTSKYDNFDSRYFFSIL